MGDSVHSSIENLQPTFSNDMTGKTPTLITTRQRVLFVGAIIFSLVCINFVFLSGFSLGYFLTVIIGEIGIFTLLEKPQLRKNLHLSIFFGICATLLAFTFLRFSDEILGFVNFLVITLLLLIQMLIHSEAVSRDWDHPRFLAELFLSPFVRPFIFIGKMVATGGSFRLSKSNPENEAGKPQRMKTLFSIILGALIAIPVLLIIVVLLSSADQIFAMYTENFLELIWGVKIREYLLTIFLGALIFPMIFSIMYSYFNKHRIKMDKLESMSDNQRIGLINPVMATTFILLLNIVYGLFTWVQFGSLFGAFSNLLPENITFAEYARNGFFQLAAVAFINIVIIIISVLLVRRNGVAGVAIRIMSILLVAFTFVLLASAGYRMKMYIDVFMLTRMRFYVSIFIILIALLLIYSVLKEFFIGFKFFKVAFLTALAILILTNFINPNRLIAQFNIDQFKNNPELTIRSNLEYFDGIDMKYLFDDLSVDAIPETIDLYQSGDDQQKMAIKDELKRIYRFYLYRYRANNWKKLNIGKEKALKAIEETLPADEILQIQQLVIYGVQVD